MKNMLRAIDVSNITSYLYKNPDIKSEELYKIFIQRLGYAGNILEIEKELEKQRYRLKNQVRNKSV